MNFPSDYGYSSPGACSDICGDCGKPWRGASEHGRGCCFGFTSEETVKHERDQMVRQTNVPSPFGATRWRSLVKNRVTVCCDYGSAGLRTRSVY